MLFPDFAESDACERVPGFSAPNEEAIEVAGKQGISLGDEGTIEVEIESERASPLGCKRVANQFDSEGRGPVRLEAGPIALGHNHSWGER